MQDLNQASSPTPILACTSAQGMGEVHLIFLIYFKTPHLVCSIITLLSYLQ